MVNWEYINLKYIIEVKIKTTIKRSLVMGIITLLDIVFITL